MKILTVLFSMVIMSNSMAQEYRTVFSDRIAYFENQGGNVRCMRIDSVKYQSDSILYPFSNIQEKGFNCITPYGASWIGEKIYVNDSLNLFFNKNHDTIKIRTNARLNDSWIAYELKDSLFITAKVIKFDTLLFLGLIDSVKTIGFQVYDKSMNPIDHILNDMNIMISKKYGFVRTLNFYLFPDFGYIFYPFDVLEEFTLAGLSNPQVGIKNLTWLDVFDFQVGDEFHILYQSSNYGPGCGNYSETKKTIYKYVSRNDYKDSIIYMIERKQSRQTENDGYINFSFIHDTIWSLIIPDTLFDKLPGEPIISENRAYSISMEYDTSKVIPSEYNIIHTVNDSCWSECFADGCFPAYEYLKGLGGPYYWCENAFCFGGEKNELAYYKKDTIIWGTPLIVNGIKETDFHNEIDLYPNPAKDILRIKTISSNLPFTLEIIDITGHTVLKIDINSVEFSVKLSGNLHGIYLYRMENKNKFVKTGKLLIE